MSNFFFSVEKYPFMYANKEIGVFTVDCNADGKYIYSIDIFSNINPEAIPWELKDIRGVFVSKESNLALHMTMVMVWVEERVFPPERQKSEELLERIGLTEYDQLSILKYTSGKSRNDKFWINFTSN